MLYPCDNAQPQSAAPTTDNNLLPCLNSRTLLQLRKKRVKRKLISECAKKKKSKIKRYKRTVKHSLLTKKLPVSLKWEHYNSAPNFAILTHTMFIKVRCKQHRITPHYVSPQDENVLLKACYTKH